MTSENSILRGIISDLCDVYDDKGVAIWLGAPQKWQGSDGFNYTGHTFYGDGAARLGLPQHD